MISCSGCTSGLPRLALPGQSDTVILTEIDGKITFLYKSLRNDSQWQPKTVKNDSVAPGYLDPAAPPSSIWSITSFFSMGWT